MPPTPANLKRRAAAAALIAGTGAMICNSANATSTGPDIEQTHASYTATLAPLTPVLVKSNLYVNTLFHYGLLFHGSSNGRVYFYAGSPGEGVEPWVTDGTAAGTSMIDLNPGAGDAPFDYYAQVTGFGTQTVANWGGDLWKTDGTSTGSSIVSTLTPTQFIAPQYAKYFGPSDKLIFGTSDGSLYSSDLTPAGTQPIPSDAFDAPSYIRTITELDGYLYYRNDSAVMSRINEATGDVEAIIDAPGHRSIGMRSLVPLGSKLLTTAYVNTDTGNRLGYEISVIDSATATIDILFDIAPGSDGSSPTILARANDLVLFSANTADSGRELWRTDGTAGGTFQVMDLNDGAASGISDDYSYIFTSFHNKVLFAATPESESSHELWASDGTEQGTKQLLDLDTIGIDLAIDSVLQNDTGVFFTAAQLQSDYGLLRNTDSIWYSDGTASGTYKLADINRIVTAITLLNDKIIFATQTEADYDGSPVEIWSLDLYTEDFAQIRLNMILSNFGATAYGDEIIPGDVTGDGITDIADLNWVLRNWPGGEAPDISVPEPGALAIVVLGAGLLVGRRRA